MRISPIYRLAIYVTLILIWFLLFVLGINPPASLCLATLVLSALLFEGTQVLLKIQFSDTLQFVLLIYITGLVIRVLFALGITRYFEFSYNDLLGRDPQDELSYYRNSLEIAKGRWSQVKLNSDAGASFYYGLLAWIAGGNIYLMKVLNAVVAAFIPIQTYFLAIKMSDQRVAKGAAYISVFFPLYLVHMGFLFKESVMLVLLLLALNSLYRIKENTWFLGLVILLTSISLTFFFRTLTAISLLIISGLWFYLRRPNLRLFIMLGGVLFSFVLLRFSAVGAEIMNYASLLKAENLGGYLGFLLQSDGIRLTPILYCQFLLLSIIGPLPSLIDSPSDYISLLVPYRYLKVMMSPLIYYGLFLFVKDKKSNLIVVVYVFLNFLGIWFAGFFLVDIFQFIFYPIFISAFMRALVEFNVLSKKYLIYVFSSFLLVIYWNAFV